jgi:hypothetical protein
MALATGAAILSHPERSNAFYNMMTMKGKKSMVATTVAWNPSDKDSGLTLSNSNRTAYSATSWQGVRSVTSHSSGKYYFEMTNPVGGSLQFGILNNVALAGTYIGAYTNGYAQSSNGSVYNNGSAAVSYASWAPNSLIGCAADLTAGKIWFSYNGIWQGGGSPSAGTNPACTGISGTFFVAASCYGGSCVITNPSQPPPSGFSVW